MKQREYSALKTIDFYVILQSYILE